METPPTPAVNSTPFETRTLMHCLVCGSPRLRQLAMRYSYRGLYFPAVRCGGCGVRFLKVQPAGESLADMYSETYFEEDFRCGRSDVAYDREDVFRLENQGLLDDFERLRRPGNFLEVGCAAGWLMKHAQERGWKARGVELSSSAVAHARSLGLDVFEGDLPGAALPADTFDLVYMGDVLEHVPDCRLVMAEVARVLKPGGHFYLRGPTTTNSLARRAALGVYGLLGRTITLREPPYHLWEFTPGSHRDLATRVGLRTVEIREAKIPPGKAHGQKSAFQRLAMAAIDAVNLPLTRMLNVLGDRVVQIAIKP